MRHYVPKKNNPNHLPHTLYMQMLYVIRDYDETNSVYISRGRKKQWQAVEMASRVLREEYAKRREVYGTLKPLQAFFDYAYFSYMFMQKSREMGASKKLWNLYRCRFARLVAEQMGLT